MTASLRPARSELKYYIHDSTTSLRFQLLGRLSEGDVAELQGCWTTARTTIAGRKLIIDLRGLHGTDEPGKQWLLSMAHEGAEYLPATYFRDGLAAPDENKGDRKPPLHSRIVSLFRGRQVPAIPPRRVP